MAATDMQNAAIVLTKGAGRGMPLRARSRLVVGFVALAVVAGVALLPALKPLVSQRGAQRTQATVAAASEPQATLRNGPSSLAPRDEVDAALAWLASLKLRNVVVCQSNDIDVRAVSGPSGMRVVTRRCRGSATSATAHEIATSGPQAVVFDGKTSDAVVFIEALRGEGSFAIVVMTSAAEPRQVARIVRPLSRTWLAATAIAEPASGAPQAMRVGFLTTRGTIFP